MALCQYRWLYCGGYSGNKGWVFERAEQTSSVFCPCDQKRWMGKSWNNNQSSDMSSKANSRGWHWNIWTLSLPAHPKLKLTNTPCLFPSVHIRESSLQHWAVRFHFRLNETTVPITNAALLFISWWLGQSAQLKSKLPHCFTIRGATKHNHFKVFSDSMRIAPKHNVLIRPKVQHQVSLPRQSSANFIFQETKQSQLFNCHYVITFNTPPTQTRLDSRPSRCL